MSDLISRQAALDKLKEHRSIYCDPIPESFSKLSYPEKCRVDELDTAIATIVNLPSVEPERKPELRKFIEKVFETLREMDDAVDVICNLDVDAVLDRMEVDG